MFLLFLYTDAAGYIVLIGWLIQDYMLYQLGPIVNF